MGNGNKIRIAFCAMLPAMSMFCAFADSETIGGYTLDFGINDDAAMIYRVYPAEGALTIPSTLGGKPVTIIGDSAFSGCSGLTNVTIPDSVTSIGSFAFESCSGLTSVTIPGRTSIGDEAFSYCYRITSVTISQSLYWRLSSVFPNSYRAITNVVLIGDVTSIVAHAFDGCSGLTNVTIPDSVTSIGASAFAGCDSLVTLKIPSGVTAIGANAFDCPAYWTSYYRAYIPADGVLGGTGSSGNSSSAGGTSSGGTTSGGTGYALSDTVGNSTITSMTVSGDTAIDSFLLADGQVFDMAIRIVNTADSAVRLSLPSGYDYETTGSADPLEIPASSTNMVTITRTSAKTFLVSRQQLRAVR